MPLPVFLRPDPGEIADKSGNGRYFRDFSDNIDIISLCRAG